MSLNAIQLQRGLSLPQFQANYGTRPHSERALEPPIGPKVGSVFPAAASAFFLTRNGQGRQLWECLLCRYQSSSIVGTVMGQPTCP